MRADACLPARRRARFTRLAPVRRLLAHPSSADVATSLLKSDLLYAAKNADSIAEMLQVPRLRVVTDALRPKVFASA